jgi:hypothetical protein
MIKDYILLALVCHPLIVLAQTQPIPVLPPGPWPAKMPEYGAWNLVFQYSSKETKETKETSNAAYQAAWQKQTRNDPVLAKYLARHPQRMQRPSRTKEITVEKTGNIRKDTVIFTTGEKTARWYTSKWFIKQEAGTGNINLEPLGDDQPDFPELAWISKNNFKEIRKINGMACAVFEGKVENLQIDDLRLFNQIGGTGTQERSTAIAIINIQNKLPVSLECADIRRIYHFGPPPSSKLALPKELREKIQTSEQRTAIRNAPLSPP